MSEILSTSLLKNKLLINKSIEIIEWSSKENIGIQELPSLLNLKELAGLAKSINHIISNDSIDGVPQLLRSMIEHYFHLLYLLEKDFDVRGLQFLFFYYKKKEEEYRRLKNNTIENSKFKAKINQDGNINIDWKKLEIEDDVIATLESLEETINAKGYRPFLEYYNNSKPHAKKYWFSLLDGPLNIEKLAERLKMTAQYEYFYRLWSGSIHAWNIVNKNLDLSNEELVVIKSFQNLDGADIMIDHSIQLLRSSIMEYVRVRRPEKIISLGLWLETNKLADWGKHNKP